ncbi:DsbA family oxidoreductase [Gemmobacter fulvus]|uniref:DsbA family oxidoreductase n=1 Tax=Gemmobacter fulvus TaxID=2840474 RepID=A0A975S1D4_9RHOB|nr:DsbA family oxidoreductase [Gemmobacter fulvus]MBT9245145.1 DsbA family oxidoreductase [Gemmobacter fulvus]MDQ1848013.1 DsbA family oxidoreductase [Gemmobacter fulvus]QWK90517.1 DsbA family oxidoreductase [Gemmobacter fulvus]
MIRLDIFSDPVCPWCYLGKANLDRALEAHPDHPFTIEWHPFQLAPLMPAEGVDRASYLLRIFGTQERTVAAHLRLEELGREAGVTFNFAAIHKVPNTLDAHRMIHWAGLEGRQSAMVSALFRAYWREGRDIGAQEVLADLAAEAGMDRALALRLLATDEDKDAVRARETHARQKGITAVPTFIVADQHVLSGAQPPKLWAQVIAELARG